MRMVEHEFVIKFQKLSQIVRSRRVQQCTAACFWLHQVAIHMNTNAFAVALRTNVYAFSGCCQCHKMCVQQTINKRMRFVELPPELQLHVLRHLSSRPWHVYSASYMEASDVLRLVSTSSVVREQARNTFHTLSTILVSADSDIHSVEYDESHDDPGLHVKAEEIETVLQPLLRYLRQVLKSLCFDAGQLCTRRQWIEELRGMSRLRRLDLVKIDAAFPLGETLEACGGRLTQLALSAPPSDTDTQQSSPLAPSLIAALSRNAVGLRRLKLDAVEPCEHLSQVWAAAGPTLHALTLLGPRATATAPDVAETDYRALYCDVLPHCEYLEELELGQLSHPAQSACAVELCARLGNQLRLLSVSLVRPNEIYALSAACPSADFRVSIRADLLTETLSELGSRLRAIQPTFVPVVRVPPSLGEITRGCVGLRSVTLELSSAEAARFLGGMLEAVGERLHMLRVHVYEAFPLPVPAGERAEVLNAVAKNTGQLQRLALRMALPRLQMFAVANANRELRFASLTAVGYLWDRDEWTYEAIDEWAAQSVTYLAKCPKLNEIRIETDSWFEDELVFEQLKRVRRRLHERRLCISVGNDYFDTT